MAKPFYERLKAYYSSVGAVLRGEADIASIFPNTTDIGMSREKAYAEFLKAHLPSSCNVKFGGFVFNLTGDESKQVDLLVTSDTCPQFNFPSSQGQGKTFACVEGLLAVASIKSTLNSAELIDSLKNIASLPSKNELGNRAMPFINIPSYEDWPFKIIYASDGISMETILRTLSQFYHDNPQISVYNRPNIIHVAGKYNVVKTGQDGGKTRDGKLIPKHSFFANPDQTDVFALAYVVQRIQQHTVAARNILFNYDSILNSISFEN